VPKQAEHHIKITDRAAVYVDTNNGGPRGADVWWLLNDNTGQTKVALPQMATGGQRYSLGCNNFPASR